MAVAVEDAKARLAALKRRKDPWLTIWQELAEIYLPGAANLTTKRHAGERMNEHVFDGTPRLAARGLHAAIDGLIKPKTSNWFEPYFEDEELMDVASVREWLNMVRERMWRVIYRKDARFTQRSAEVDAALVVFGWGPLFINENRGRNGILFKSYSVGDTCFDEDADGVVDTFSIEETLTARQAIKRFGEEKVHQEIRDAASKEGSNTEPQWVFAQLVMPQDDPLAGHISTRGFKYSSIVFDVKNEHMLAEGGFHEFPVAVPRWETHAGQIYPYSPGMVALPDSHTLQAISKTLLVGGERAVDPPIMVPSDAFLSPIRTYPGGLSVYDVQAIIDGGPNPPVFPFPVSGQLPVGRDMQNDYRYQVQQAFFKDVLSLPVEGFKTATEVLERKEEFVRVLGPIFGRLEADYIGASVDRIFAIMERAFAFPERPAEIEGKPVMFRYQSPLQQARKSIDVAGFSRTLEVMAPLGEVQPDIYDNLDGDQIMRDSPEWSGIPTDWLRSEDDVDALRQARAEAEQNAAQVESSKPIADSLKSVAQAQQIAGETLQGGDTGVL